MEQFCVDWARHRRVTVTSFQEKRSYDHGRTFESGFASLEPHAFSPATLGVVEPSIREDGIEDHDAVNIVSGSNALHWECIKGHRHLPDPRLAMTVGLLLNLKKPGGCKVHCIECFWGTGFRLDREPKRYCIDILRTNASKFERIYYKSGDIIHSPAHVKSNTQNGALGLLAPVTGNRFARDIPNITTTKLEFTSVATIDAIVVKFFELSRIDNTKRSPAVRQFCVWGRLQYDPLGASDVVRNTRESISPHPGNMPLDSRLFISPILGVLAVEPRLNEKLFSNDNSNVMMQFQQTARQRCFENQSDGAMLPVAANSAEDTYHGRLGTLYRLPFHLIKEMFQFLNYKELRSLATVSNSMGKFGQYIWTCPNVENCKQYINWARFPCASATATSRWNNTEDEDPNNILDGKDSTWWSSASIQDCRIDIDLGQIVPLEHIDILWGDDNGRVRPRSMTFTVETSACGRKFDIMKRFNNNNDTLNRWRADNFNVQYGTRYDILDYTTTRVTTHERCARYVRICLEERTPRWANHAITQINIYGFGRKNESCLEVQRDLKITKCVSETLCNECNTT